MSVTDNGWESNTRGSVKVKAVLLTPTRQQGFGEIQPAATASIFHFNQPQIGIEADLACDPPLDLFRREPFGLMGALPQPFNPALAGFGLWRWPVERRATVEAVDLIQIAPASAAPRRRKTAVAPSTATRRR